MTAGRKRFCRNCAFLMSRQDRRKRRKSDADSRNKGGLSARRVTFISSPAEERAAGFRRQRRLNKRRADTTPCFHDSSLRLVWIISRGRRHNGSTNEHQETLLTRPEGELNFLASCPWIQKVEEKGVKKKRSVTQGYYEQGGPVANAIAVA